MEREAIIQLHHAHFGPETVLVQAPGRINLIGEHTDYNHGLVLPAAIDCRLYFALSKNEQAVDQVTAYSADFKESASFSLAKQSTGKVPGWLRYLEAITSELQERGYQPTGFTCTFGGNIPIGSGLSSSAALTCGLLTGLSRLFAWGMEREEIALIAQAAEHRVGILCGLMDQYAVLFGKAGKVIQLDCRNLQVDYFPCELGDHCLLLLNTKVEHALASTGYNDRRASCERVLAEAKKAYPEMETLRDINPAILDSLADINAEDKSRVRFIIAENERVRQTTIALQSGRLEEVGKLLYASHEGLSNVYEVSCKELDVLVALSRDETAILGARMMGGGFGGCTINLVQTTTAEAVAQRMLSAYKKATGIKGEAFVVNIGEGIT